jgi:hypothetical protein
VTSFFFGDTYQTFRSNLLPLFSSVEEGNPYFSTLKTEAADSSEMFLSLYNTTTQDHIPEGGNRTNHLSENLKPHKWDFTTPYTS